MNLKHLLLLCCFALIFASCSHYYEPALYHQDISYQPKPTSFDSTRSANYISGGLNFYTNPNGADGLTSGELNLSRAYVFNHFNLSYGAVGVAGEYQNGSIKYGQPNYFTQKFFGAVGGRASANLFASNVNTDFRYLGIEMAYSHEFGSYTDFRQEVVSQPDYHVDPRTELFTVGLTSEAIWKTKHFQHSIRFFFGTTLGTHNLNNPQLPNAALFLSPPGNFFPKLSYFIKINNYFATAEIGSALFLRFGYKF